MTGWTDFKTTAYFREQVLSKRPYLKPEWCLKALKDKTLSSLQQDGRKRYWCYIEEANKYLRVVTLEDGETLHNAFLRSQFQRRTRMKFQYYPETDSLYIDLSGRPSKESVEVSPGVVIDYDETGQIVGLDIDQASRIVNLTSLEAQALPVGDISLSA